MARQINFNAHLIKIYGAYIRTNISSVVDINGVASGVVGIVGLAERGEAGVPTRVYSYVDLVEKFGDGPVVRHGLAMFIGGASELVVVRIGSPKQASLTATKINPNLTNAQSYTVAARENGTFGNNISFSVEDLDVLDNDSANISSVEDNLYRINIRYADKYGNDLREQFVFPRYIPLAETTTNLVGPDGDPLPVDHGKFYNENTDRYFLLRDRVTGELREVPEIWTFGAVYEDNTVPGAIVTLGDFIRKLDELKSTSEDLLTFPVFNAGSGERTPYPISIISHVINNGGFGYDRSRFVTIEDINPVLEDIIPDLSNTITPGEIPLEFNLAEMLIPHPPVALSGGTNGDDGTSFYLDASGATLVDYAPTLGGNSVSPEIDLIAAKARAEWTIGLGVLEEEDVNFVQLAYLFNPKAHSRKGTTWNERIGFFYSVIPLLNQHITTQSNTPNRKFRTSVVGVPWYKSQDTKARQSDMEFLDAIKGLSGLINSDRIQLFVGGFSSRAFSTSLENYGAEMLASFVVGIHSSLQPQESITFRQISGIFTDGLEFYWSTAAKNEIYSRAYNSVFRRKNSTGALEYIAANNLTSWTGSSNRGMIYYITRRITDYMNSFVYKNLEENFIGRQSRGAETINEVQRFTEYLLDRLKADGVLVAWANLSVSTVAGDPTVFEITYDFQPVSEINFILTTNRLTYTLA